MATFSDLVREAFIDPLRSVLIIDDQYPTWEEILNNAFSDAERDQEIEARSTAKEWQQLPSGPLRVIKQFRRRNPGFIIDIHDGIDPDAGNTLNENETPVSLASHLYQSDLLILDYNLEGAVELRGQKARSILQSVLMNNHFNLIVIHTGEDDLNEVFNESLLCLMQSCTARFDDSLKVDLEKLDEKLDDLESDDEFNRSKLSEFFTMSQYIELRHPDALLNNSLAEFMRSTGILASLSQWAKGMNLKGKDLKTFFYWAIREFEKGKFNDSIEKQYDSLKWNNGSDCKWLRTVRGFVVFVKKDTEDLLSELQRALESWKPTPSRLLSAKYRSELVSTGVMAEDRTLLNSHVFAHFYKDICESDSEESSESEAATERLREGKLKDHVSRQSEAISLHIENEIIKFGQQIVIADIDSGNNFSSHYGVDLDNAVEAKKAVAHYNSYVSSLPLKQGLEQLDSGHVFKVDNEWWVCATPSCDLQPTQNSIAFMGTSKELRPFTALRLSKIEINELSPAHVNSGEYCFIEESPQEVICLGMRSVSEAGKPANSKVTWRTFLAKRNGLIESREFKVIMPKLDGSSLLVNEEKNAEVFSKLRYEYALNYIQKIGISTSRIGLGYLAI